MPSTVQRIRNLFHQRQGPLTRELLRTPGKFGLGQVPSVSAPDAVTDMVCGFCATGCSLRVHLNQYSAVNLSPTTDYPVNQGMACPKGWEALNVLDSDERGVTPLVRDESGRMAATDWDSAMRAFTDRFKAIQEEHGTESVAFISTGQIPSEEMAFLGALAKFGMGIRHGDGNTRQCMASAVVAYKQSFGFDAPPYTYEDFEESDVIVLVGSNLCIAHPIMWERVMRNPHSPEIIVVDPRMTETAMNATSHLAVKPKSDQTLLYGIARILIDHEWIDKQYIAAHTNEFEEFATFVSDFTDERIVAETGLSVEQVHEFAEAIHLGKRVSFWWTMGVNQSHQGVRTAQALINLALMTGNIGRPGTGANSITGQCNAMGSRLFSNTTGLLGGHDFTNPEHRKKIADILKIDVSLVPAENSLAYNEIMEGILSGRIRGLWVICTNPAHSWINQNQCRDILQRLDFLVVQDMYASTETAQMADLFLPAASWGEKEGTFINSERRIGVLKKVRQAPGQALSDFKIFQLIARYWGCGDMFEKWKTPEDVFQILKQCTVGQPCDVTGIRDYRHLEEQRGIQWPLPEGEEIEGLDANGSKESAIRHAQRRLFGDGRFYHADGRAKFLFEAPRPLKESPSAGFPFLLLTGRATASQWHTQTRTAKSAVLQKLSPQEIYVEVNPGDARQLGLAPGDLANVASQRGRILARTVCTHAVQPGQVFVAMHYEAANRLTDAVFDPYSKQPAYKACAVSVSRFRS